MGFRMLRPAAALLAVLLLAGCVPGDPVVTPEPEPDSTPVFASDEEALAAATDAYAKYLEVSDEITADGGRDPERLKPYVTEEQFEIELRDMQEILASGTETRGSSQFEIIDIQQLEESGGGSADLAVYLCLDVSSVRVVDDSGNDVTPGNRSERVPLEVGFQISNEESLQILISRSEIWSGTNFCG